ncbi:hypothetical protein P8452_08576 [Trifolium repens]|nr:hypothetical protein P8452_08576 [Trifolium repens]
MATVIKKTLKTLLHSDEVENNPLTMTDEQILDQIYSTHVHNSDTKFDAASLFTLAHNTLARSTHIVDSVVQGNKVSLEHTDDKSLIPNFSSPLCTLKQISSELSCKPPSEETAHKTTLAILNKLSHYDWEAKAVLTISAFALEYGEFWLLEQHLPTDPLAKSVAFLKRVPILTKPAAIQKHRQAITELNSLVKITVQVLEFILELDNLNERYDTKVVPALELAVEQIPVDVYWTIITIAAIVTQLDCLITESEHKQELSHYGQKINIILSRLRKHITLARQQIDTAKYIQELKKLLQTPTEITVVLSHLIFPKGVPQLLYDGATKTTVDINVVLKKKNVYLFISTLDVTDEEITAVRTVYESIKTNEQYKIVWVPIVETWNEQLHKKFEILKSKIPWYVVQNVENIAGFKFINEEWDFKKKATFVVFSPQGKVQHPNAFHLIKAYGIKAFPFTLEDEKRIQKERNWLVSVVGTIDRNTASWHEQGKHIFYYGGHDKEWIQQFTKYATALSNDATIKEAKISIELFYVDKEDKNLVSRFWGGIESLFVTKIHKTTDVVTQEVQKLLSYKNETGWALLSKGPSVVLSGHGSTILKTVAEFDKWKDVVIKKGFEFAFTEYHTSVARVTHRCSHLEIPIVAGKLPETIKCPDCPSTMEIFISYKCCHNKTNANSKH